MDWPLATGAVLDAAALYAAFVDGEHVGVARLLHRDGSRMAAMLARLFAARDDDGEPPRADDVDALAQRLAAAGYAVHAQASAQASFEALRRGYAGRVAALAGHFGLERPRLLPDASGD